MQIKPSKKTLLMHSKQIRWASLGEWIPRFFEAATNVMVLQFKHETFNESCNASHA